jgi:hypothetical protein
MISGAEGHVENPKRKWPLLPEWGGLTTFSGPKGFQKSAGTDGGNKGIKSSTTAPSFGVK